MLRLSSYGSGATKENISIMGKGKNERKRWERAREEKESGGR